MRQIVGTLIVLFMAATFCRKPLAQLTYYLAKETAWKQQHMLSLGKLNRTLVGKKTFN